MLIIRSALVFAVALLTLAFAEPASAHLLSPERQSFGIRLIHSVDHKVRATHACQEEMEQPRTRSSGIYRKAGVPYRLWAHALWKKRMRIQCNRLKAVMHANENWFAASIYANLAFPGAYAWLISCSASEGGHTGWVRNRQGSGADGWLQFMESTFYSNVDRAFGTSRSRGVVVLNKWRSWYSPAGQALTGASMWSRGGGNHPTWVGGGCQENQPNSRQLSNQ